MTINQPDTPATDVPTELDGILVIIGSVLLVIVVGGSFFLGIKALDALKISVPPEIVDKIAQQTVAIMKETMDTIGKQVLATPTPMDDAAYAIGKIPFEKLIEEINKRTLSPEESMQAYHAIQRTLDDTLTSPFLKGNSENPYTPAQG
ncbi:hypothetical protein C8B47_10755 [filamentous cyanobacterium CCP4]|nr:hypothetical protein C8B47_10755 [filamentous cyanobacterium CCP4]